MSVRGDPPDPTRWPPARGAHPSFAAGRFGAVLNVSAPKGPNRVSGHEYSPYARQSGAAPSAAPSAHLPEDDDPMHAESGQSNLVSTAPSAAELLTDERTLNVVTSIMTESAWDGWFWLTRRYTMNEYFNLQDTPALLSVETVSLKSNVGPYAARPPLQLTGRCRFVNYAKQVLGPMMDYLDNAHIVYHDTTVNTCFLHGGLDASSFNVAAYVHTLKPTREPRNAYDTVRLADVSPSATLNQVHKLGFGGSISSSPITGRLPCYNNQDDVLALRAMHPFARNTVVGHTPQHLGIPTISRVANRFLIQLDTQFTNRQINNHCLALDENGDFLLRGSWRSPWGQRYLYEACSKDPLIGTLLKTKDSLGAIMNLRCVARVIDTKKHSEHRFPEYIYVHYASKADQRGNIIDDRGDGSLAVVSPVKSASTVSISKPLVVVCGDVEASVDFLRGFLYFAMEIVEPYGGPDPPVRNVHHAHDRASWLQQKGVRIVSIGDVIGDPNGAGADPSLSLSSLADEAAVLRLMNEFAFPRIVGNRDINKLRFLDEVPILNRWETLVDKADDKLDEFSRWEATQSDNDFRASSPANPSVQRLVHEASFPYLEVLGGAINARDPDGTLPYVKDQGGLVPTVWNFAAIAQKSIESKRLQRGFGLRLN
jgi:hypothetical protein